MDGSLTHTGQYHTNTTDTHDIILTAQTYGDITPTVQIHTDIILTAQTYVDITPTVQIHTISY